MRSALLFKYSLLLFNLDYCPIVFSNNLCEVKHFPRHKFYSAKRSALIQKTFIKIFFYSRRQKSSTRFCFRRETTVFWCQRAKTKMRIIFRRLGNIWVSFFLNKFIFNFPIFGAAAIYFYCCQFIAPVNTQILDNYFRATGENICRHFLSLSNLLRTPEIAHDPAANSSSNFSFWFDPLPFSADRRNLRKTATRRRKTKRRKILISEFRADQILSSRNSSAQGARFWRRSEWAWYCCHKKLEIVRNYGRNSQKSGFSQRKFAIRKRIFEIFFLDFDLRIFVFTDIREKRTSKDVDPVESDTVASHQRVMCPSART